VFTDYQDLSDAHIDPAEIDLALVGARSALERRHF
jgi:hypothetical protein